MKIAPNRPSPIPPLTTQIDMAIRERRVNEARSLIRMYLKLSKSKAEASFRAAEFYRRLSDYNSALRVLKNEFDPNARKPTAWQKKGQLRMARILNLLGASSYALRIANNQTLSEQLESPTDVVGIYISNYRYDRALPFLAPMANRELSQLSYHEKFQLILLSDCYCGLARFNEARLVLKNVITNSNDHFLSAVAHQALGATFIKESIHTGDFLSASAAKLADEGLSQSEKLFSHGDSSVDMGLLLKWRGIQLICMNHNAKAQQYLEKSLAILSRPGFKPEAWLEVLFWIGLGKFQENKNWPAEWTSVITYVSPSFPPKKWIQKIYPDFSINGEFKFDNSREDYTIDMESNEITIGNRTILGLKNSHWLIAHLQLAGRVGIPQFRVYEILWPDELFSFASHQKRLEQTVLQARTQKGKISWKDSHLILEKFPGTCLWAERPTVKGIRFLQKHSEFSQQVLIDYYKMSSRSAEQLVQSWKSAGLINVKSLRPKAIYQTCFEKALAAE